MEILFYSRKRRIGSCTLDGIDLLQKMLDIFLNITKMKSIPELQGSFGGFKFSAQGESC
jgi:hypothetical protein